MFPFFPYTNFHELNADWLLKTVKQIADSVSQFADNLAHVVRVTAQTFTADEQRIACGNIKAVSYHTQSNSADDRTTARANLQAVGYEAQTLTETQQTAARGNISAASQADMTAAEADIQRSIRWDAQSLSDAQKAQARSNIGASQVGTIPAGVVRYDTAQTLTGPQKTQARENIGAASAGDLPDDYEFFVSENEQGTGYEVTGNLSDAAQATGRVFIVLEKSGRTREALAELTYTGGTLSSVGASFADFFAADSSIPNTITQVIITNSGATVTDIQQQQVPHPAPLGADRGKVLVAGNNTCSWVDKGPLVVTFSGRDVDGNAACDKTWAQIQAAGDNIKVIYRVSETEFYTLTPHMGSILKATYLDINDLGNPSGNYTQIICRQSNENLARCSFKQVGP